ncbi:MAG: hypothetical protein ACLFQK_01570 [Fibrobacterota bacterium]
MQLPKYKKKKRTVLKTCAEPGCGREFIGHPISKYCEKHRDIRNRQRKKKVFESIDENNMVFEHDFHETIETEFVCRLKGCDNKYKVKLMPRQHIYPKYCEEHRNSFKRSHFLESREKTA